MEYLYTVALLIHLICAIIFLGYIFFDVVILPTLSNKFDTIQYEEIKAQISAKASTIMPIAVLVLISTGIIMLSNYMNINNGYTNTHLQMLMGIKALLGFIIGIMVLYSIVYKKFNGTPHPFLKKYIHKIALAIGLVIVILAKVMFAVY